MFHKQFVFFLLIAVYAVDSQPLANPKNVEYPDNDMRDRIEGFKTKMLMTFGDHGKTVIEFPNGKQFFEINHERSKCDGTIQKNGECSGTVGPVDYDVKENFCYVRNKITLGDYECLASGSSIQIKNVDGKTVCISDNGKAKTLFIPVAEYEKLCGNVADDPTYTYFTDLNDPESVQIPNPNKYVTCENNEPNVCVFKTPKF